MGRGDRFSRRAGIRGGRRSGGVAGAPRCREGDGHGAPRSRGDPLRPARGGGDDRGRAADRGPQRRRPGGGAPAGAGARRIALQRRRELRRGRRRRRLRTRPGDRATRLRDRVLRRRRPEVQRGLLAPAPRQRLGRPCRGDRRLQGGAARPLREHGLRLDRRRQPQEGRRGVRRARERRVRELLDLGPDGGGERADRGVRLPRLREPEAERRAPRRFGRADAGPLRPCRVRPRRRLGARVSRGTSRPAGRAIRESPERRARP